MVFFKQKFFPLGLGGVSFRQILRKGSVITLLFYGLWLIIYFRKVLTPLLWEIKKVV